jgi:hypothetical protein
MALLTKTGINKILRRIMESGEMTEEMENDISRIQSDFDERTGYLSGFGEVQEGEDIDEYVYTVTETAPPENDSEDWKTKYNDMRKKYMDRFFGNTQIDDETDKIVLEQEEDIKRDGEPQTFDELLERVEG